MQPTDFNTFDTPAYRCPSCQKHVNATTSTQGHKPPVPGDLTICVYCHAVLIIDPQARGHLRGLTLAEWDDLRRETPETYEHLIRMRETLRQHSVCGRRDHRNDN